MRRLGYVNCIADSNLWLRKTLKPKYENASSSIEDVSGKKRRKVDDSYKYYYSYAELER